MQKLKFLFMISFLFLFLAGCTRYPTHIPSNEDSNAIITESLRLYYLDLGQTYSAQTSVTLSSGETEYIKVFTSDSVTHLTARKLTLTSNLAIEFQTNLYEGCDSITNGTLINNFNKNRNYPNDNGTMIFYNNPSGVNLTNSITLPFNNHLHSEKKFSVGETSEIEYVLASNEVYCLALTNDDGGTLEVDITWEWFEHSHSD